MFVAILQVIPLLLAGFALWRLWRRLDRHPPLIRTIAAGGFILRSFAAQALFWVSFLGLPFGRSLQLGRGFWFFGLDGTLYFKFAERFGVGGPLSIQRMPDNVPSIVYVKILALFVWLFGAVPSVALLLNLFSFLGTVLLMSWWAARYEIPPRMTAIPVAAISFLPSWILWSLQPLKDAFFCFLVVLFAFCIDEFREGWSRGRTTTRRAGRLLAIAVLIAVTAYALAGIRWYYALIGLAAGSVPLVAIAFVARPPREILARIGSVMLLMVVISQEIVAGAGPYLPPNVRAVMRPSASSGGTVSHRIVAAFGTIREARENFDRYRTAGTRIRAGTQVAKREASSTPALPPPVAYATPPPPARRPAAKALAAPPKKKHLPARVAPAPTPAPLKPAASAAVAAKPKPAATTLAEPQPDLMPESTDGRLLSGFAALLLPHIVAMRLGLISVGGGRGLWWFADLDTVLFDGIIILTAVLFVTLLRQGAWRDPFVWYLVLASAATGAALAYTVSNFGTLFRHREMVVATVALLVSALCRRVRTLPTPKPS